MRCLLLAASFALLTGAAPPPSMEVQGVLRSAGGATVDGDYAMKVSIFGDKDAKTTLWSDSYLSVPVQGGVFQLTLGGGAPLDLGALAASDGLWLGITVEKDTLPVTPLATVAYAVRAQRANVCDAVAKMGSGSGLDADLLDGKDLSEILDGVATEAKQDQGLSNDAAMKTTLAGLATAAKQDQGLANDGELKATLATLATAAKQDAAFAQGQAIVAKLADLATAADLKAVATQVALLGANTSDNAIDTSKVSADAKGSVLERLEALQKSFDDGIKPKPIAFSETCADWAALGWLSREACLRDGKWHRFGNFTQKVAMPDFATLQTLADDGADLRVQYTGSNRAVVNISRVIRACNSPNRLCLYGVREYGTGWATIGMYVGADDANGNYWVGAVGDVSSLDVFFQGTGSGLATGYFDFTLDVRAGGWHKYGTFGGAAGLSQTTFNELRALALRGARFKVAAESGTSYKLIHEVVRVIPDCGTTCMWMYARREHSNGGQRTLGMELSTGASNGNYWIGDPVGITSLDTFFTGTSGSVATGSYLYTLYVEE